MKSISWEVHRVTRTGTPKITTGFLTEADARLAAMNMAMQSSYQDYTGTVKLVEVTREEEVLDSFTRNALMTELTPPRVKAAPTNTVRNIMLDHDADMADD